MKFLLSNKMRFLNLVLLTLFLLVLQQKVYGFLFGFTFVMLSFRVLFKSLSGNHSQYFLAKLFLGKLIFYGVGAGFVWFMPTDLMRVAYGILSAVGVSMALVLVSQKFLQKI